MAHIHPAGWREFAATSAAERELQTLAQLAAGLSDRYTVYHGVHWTRAKGSYAVFGEIDFVVVGPTGKLLLIEQKSGFLAEGDEGLHKNYAGKRKSVPMQMARNADALARRLRQACDGEAPAVESLLYCPDYQVKSPGTAGIDPQRIVDAPRRDALLATIRAIVPEQGEASPQLARIHRFLAEVLELVPEVHALVGEAQALSTRLSGGLAQWARCLSFSPFRLRVTGTAGSGKTQLAMAVFRDALAAGRRPLYVCYNRPLADHIAGIAPAGGEVVTYHQLADRVARSRGEAPDFSRPDAFARLEAGLDEYQPPQGERFDVLIVDEGQDFPQRWCDNLLRLLHPEGSAWWLEDPLQNLYGRPPVALPGWVELRSATNYRTPQDILRAVERLLPLPAPLEAGSPLGAGPAAGGPASGADIDLVAYADTAELVARTVAAITRAIGLGFRRQHIAVLTYRGREHSALAPYDRIGPYPLIAPTGRYDLFGKPILTEGDVLIDSVHRFKGRAAPCVILTEIDFETLDEAAMRRIFVGATRATMRLLLVASARSAALLRERLEGDANPDGEPRCP